MSGDKIGELEATLSRAALGMPVRHLVVTLRYFSAARAASESDDVMRLRALGVSVAEVVTVMEAEAARELREVDWLEWRLERYDLPSSIRQNWPSVWDVQK
ncbi:hypothetical protein GSI_07750 [Ganoderma sinense ZZ0214-1]|uniref:Uncharacterized protein n=1 Tax=Ganoderma sinense ZZ0214-1 TaxID=1077348 RepID=A0A2G8S8R5_9APHY|nr:hypothetical protein GSI_07750 [Ganoderma sinense ZZ0214-1]